MPISRLPQPSVITQAGITSQYVVQGIDDTVVTHLDTGSVAVQTAFMLIDLSDTTNWPHAQTGHLHLEYIIIEVDPDTSFLGEIKVGFLDAVDATNGDFHQFIDIDMAKKSDILVENLNFGSHGMHLVSAKIFGPIIANSALFQTDVDLGGPDDPSTLTYPSGAGDMVLLVERSAGTVDVSLTIGYKGLV